MEALGLISKIHLVNLAKFAIKDLPWFGMDLSSALCFQMQSGGGGRRASGGADDGEYSDEEEGEDQSSPKRTLFPQQRTAF